MLRERLMWIAWPAFLMAAVLEFMVFAVLDPQALTLFGEPSGWSREGVYTVTFFIFWAVMMLSGALTTLLSKSPFDVNRRQSRALR
ncbi:MAG TPA: hypothetical protein PLA33_04655 [Ottowia sp.]|nr:hypothetical protein [Ottowia sp.]HNI84566.1 hypothetical protein [Ottowia sp.]HNJ45399.1 hypothetical protein [Ottowia sp.]HNK54046.1 hypothetical protein [Ottowia sp.]HNL41356.1 hypothetical protein [Ottowia sp.]